MTPFAALAHKYDTFNAADIDGYTSFIVSALGEAKIPVREILDVGCGTGEITLRLARAGYDMIGVDSSSEMLGELKKKPGGDGILLLMQDMRHLDLYGTVQAAVCTFDCLNYLPDNAALREALASISLFLEPGGVFIFDVNTERAYKDVYGTNSYVYEDGDDMLVWQNFYDGRRKCDFALSLFEKKGGSYVRSDEIQTQTYFSPRTLKSALSAAGLAVSAVYGSIGGSPCADTDAKAYYVCVRTKG